jgi:hypothetical protein
MDLDLSACRTRDRSRSSVLDVTNSALWIARAHGESSIGSMRTPPTLPDAVKNACRKRLKEYDNE